MSHSLLPTSTTLNTGTTYEFKATISSSYNVTGISYSLTFWDSADGGYDHIMHDYTTYIAGENFWNDTRSYSKTVTVPSQAKRASLSISYTEDGSARYGEQIYSFSTPVTLSNPGNAVIGQKGDYYYISWTPAVGSGAPAGTVVKYNLREFHEGDELLAEDTTQTSVQIPFYFPGEQSEAGEGIGVHVIARYGGLETESEKLVIWLPQHILYCYDGSEWRQCEIYYYDGAEFRPCKINYYNQGWLG